VAIGRIVPAREAFDRRKPALLRQQFVNERVCAIFNHG
jgi:hypothetical protein